MRANVEGSKFHPQDLTHYELRDDSGMCRHSISVQQVETLSNHCIDSELWLGYSTCILTMPCFTLLCEEYHSLDKQGGAGAQDKQCLAEMKQRALLPLQTAMRVLTAAEDSTCSDESEHEMHMAAMRILANVSWVLELADKSTSQGGEAGEKDVGTKTCKT